MATLDLGKIKFTWKAAYSGVTAYEKDDVVSYGGNVYICKLAATNILPTNTTYWDVMVQGVNILTTLGDLATHNGTSTVRFGLGPAGQVLTASPSGIIWAPASGWRGQTPLQNITRQWVFPSGYLGGSNIPWLGEVGMGPSTSNLRIACGLPNPRLGPRTAPRGGYNQVGISMYLNDQYEVVARGTTEYGLVGKYAHTHNHANTTVHMSFSGEFGLLESNDHFVQIHLAGAAGAAMALTKNGDVFFMGYNGYGLAGAGHTTDVYAWTKIPYLGPGASVSGLSCRIIGLWISQELNGQQGSLCTAFAIDENYRLWSWGYNGQGECGIGNTTTPQTTPQLVTGLPNCQMIHARPGAVMGVDNVGQLFTWGLGNNGWHGLGSTSAFTSPQVVSGMTNVYDIECHAGSHFTSAWTRQHQSYVLKSNGELFGAGYNGVGQLGNGSTTDSSSYVRCNPTLTFSTFLVNGNSNNVTVYGIGGTPGSSNNRLYGWGYNGTTQLGNNSTTNSSAAVQPDAICDTTRNRTFTYINAVTSNSDRVFPRDNIVKIWPYNYSQTQHGIFAQDNLGRVYFIGAGANFGTYRNDNAGITYSRPVLMPGPWSSEDGAVGTDFTVYNVYESGYNYGSVTNNLLQTSDGRIWHLGNNSEGEFSSDLGFNGRWMVLNP